MVAHQNFVKGYICNVVCRYERSLTRSENIFIDRKALVYRVTTLVHTCVINRAKKDLSCNGTFSSAFLIPFSFSCFSFLFAGV